MYVLLYLEFYAPTFTSAEILQAAELSPSRSAFNSSESIIKSHTESDSSCVYCILCGWKTDAERL